MFLLFALGCVSLAGEWVGEIECETTAQDVVMELESADDGKYEGEMEISGSGSSGGVSYSAKVVLEVVVEPDEATPDSKNELDVEGELDDCKYIMDGDDVSNQYCPDDGEDANFDGDWFWDEIDLIVFEGDQGCDGELERAD